MNSTMLNKNQFKIDASIGPIELMITHVITFVITHVVARVFF